MPGLNPFDVGGDPFTSDSDSTVYLTDTIVVVFGTDGLAGSITWELIGIDPTTLAETTVTAQGTPGVGIAAMGAGKYLAYVQRPAGFGGGFYRFWDGVEGDAPAVQYVGPYDPPLVPDGPPSPDVVWDFDFGEPLVNVKTLSGFLTATATRYLYVPVSATLTTDGTPQDPTGLTGSLAFSQYGDPADVDWYPATWVKRTSDGQDFLRLMVGPNGAVTLEAGNWFVFARIDATAEIVVGFSGPITVL